MRHSALLLGLLLTACSDDTSPTGGAGGGGTGGADGGAGQGGNGSGGGPGGAGGAGGESASWQLPDCASVQGTSAVTITADEGATLLPTSGTLSGVVYTFGLIAMDLPSTLLASSGGRLLRSEDAGCTWSDVGTLPVGTLQLARAAGPVAYGFYDNQDVVVRIDVGDTVTVITEDPPGAGLHGLGVDAADADHLRVVDDAGQLQDSTDGGFNWTAVGEPAANGGLFYTAVFDPTDLDHVLVGLANTGVRHSEDGGETWKTSTGVGAVGNANAFSIAFSPADPTVVYLEGFDLGAQIGEEVRRIWRSTDGGASFVPVVAEGASVTLTNGVLLAPHPTDPSVLYFEFGTYFQGYGTDIYRYDHSTGLVTKTHNDYDSVSAIAFHPLDPGVVYFGLTSEQIN